MALNLPSKQKLLNIFVITIALLLVGGFFVFAWTEPTQNPPGGNVPAPINVGSTAQTKTGRLTLPELYLNATGAEGNIYAINQLVGYNDIFIKGNSAEAAPVYLAGNQIIAYTSGQPRLTITSSGNVGIGTTSPETLLHLGSSTGGANIIKLGSGGGGPHGIIFEDDTVGSGIQLFWRTSPNQLIIEKTSDGSNGADVFSYDRDTDYFYFAGNVGIGTTSPSYKLDVQGGDIRATGYVRGGTGLCIGTDCRTSWPSGGISGSGTTNYIPKWTGSSSLGNSVIYQSGSNIGIGTTSPEYKLQVQGDIYANGGWVRVSGARGIYFQSYGGGWYMTDSTYIKNYGNKRVYLTNYLYVPRIYDKDNTSYYLDPSASSYLNTIYATGFYYSSSDISLKNDIQPLSDALEKILKLNGVSFVWKDNNKPSIGLIAQDVEKVFPELVSINPSTGLKSINYNGLIAPLIESIKTQEKTIEKQQKEIEELRAEINELKSKLK